MPLEHSKTAKKNSGNSLNLLISIVAGVFAFATISLVVSRIGMLPTPTLLFAGLSALAIGSFVWRERNLLERLENAERRSVERITHLESELNYLYESSVISLIEYDAGNLIVGRASSGFYQLMGFEPERELHGKELHSLLGIETIKIERLTERIKRNDLKAGITLSCQRVGGDVLELNVSGRFTQDNYMVELCLVCSPENFKKYTELQQMMDDLERFRKGMLRRERRIIDLKNEVNGLMAQNDQEPRYSVTSAAESGRIADMLTDLQGAKDSYG